MNAIERDILRQLCNNKLVEDIDKSNESIYSMDLYNMTLQYQILSPH